MTFAIKFFMCLALAISIVASVDADIPCFEVEVIISPCQAYLTGRGGDVPTACCDSVKQLNNMAQSTPDRQQTCRCLKSLTKTIPGINLSLATSLPKKCGVYIPYPISLETDCNKVK